MVELLRGGFPSHTAQRRRAAFYHNLSLQTVNQTVSIELMKHRDKLTADNYGVQLIEVYARNFLGYDKDESGHLIINPAEAEIVKRIFREYLEGASCQKIARGLERDGIRTARGNPRWHDSTVRKILENEKHMGDALLQKTYTIDFLNKKRGKNNGTLPQYYIRQPDARLLMITPMAD